MREEIPTLGSVMRQKPSTKMISRASIFKKYKWKKIDLVEFSTLSDCDDSSISPMFLPEGIADLECPVFPRFSDVMAPRTIVLQCPFTISYSKALHA